MKRLATIALLALIPACSDGPSGPAPVADVEILHNSSPVDERTIQVGETVQLSTSLKAADGTALTGRAVTWRSSLSSVAEVSQTGLVTGISQGETLVTATAEGVSDNVLIVVQAPPGGALVCEDADAGLALAVGEVYTTTAAGSPVMCLAGGATGSEYVLVPFNASKAGPDKLAAEIAGVGLVAPTGPPNPARLAEIAELVGLSAPELREDVEFHTRLQERAARQLTPLVRRGGGEPALFSRSQSTTAASVPSLGDVVRFNVDAQSGCSNPKYRHARVMAISNHAVVVADTLNPSGGFTQADYQHIATTFDTLVHPAVTGNFGTTVDIDDNDRAVILYTGAVNELTSANSTSYIGGFFYSRDLFPTVKNDSMGACLTSNEAEMFYMLVPDPNGEINDNVRSKDFVMSVTIGTIAHEYQHLINASRRLFLIQGTSETWNEETWLNEGMSHIAEELTFYAATNLGPEQNIDIEDLRTSQDRFTKFIQYQWSNFGRYISYLKVPREQSLMGIPNDNDLETRGATWAFLRYMADQRATSEPALWKSLVDSNLVGLANLNAALGTDALEVMRSWTVSVYTDDAVSTNTLYQQPSWDYRSVITGVKNASGVFLYPTFPLEVLRLFDGATNQRTMTLEGGGAGFLKFGIAAGGRAALRATSGGVTAPSRLKISIVRTK